MMNCSSPRAAAGDFARDVEPRLLAHDRQQQPRVGAVLARLLGDVLVEVPRVEQLADQRAAAARGGSPRAAASADSMAKIEPRPARAAAQRLRARDPGAERLQRVGGDDVLRRVVEQAQREQEVEALRLLGRGGAEQRQLRVRRRRRLQDRRGNAGARGRSRAGARGAAPHPRARTGARLPSAACARPPSSPFAASAVARVSRAAASVRRRPASGSWARRRRAKYAKCVGVLACSTFRYETHGARGAPRLQRARLPVLDLGHVRLLEPPRRDRLQRGQRLGVAGRPRPSPPRRPAPPPPPRGSSRTSCRTAARSAAASARRPARTRIRRRWVSADEARDVFPPAPMASARWRSARASSPASCALRAAL